MKNQKQSLTKAQVLDFVRRFVNDMFDENDHGHGYGKHIRYEPEYQAFHDAKYRCKSPSHKDFRNYGGRGIEFRFRSFKQFFNHIGPRPSAPYSLDRINNDGHYEENNVRWATPKEQATNKRKSQRKSAASVLIRRSSRKRRDVRVP